MTDDSDRMSRRVSNSALLTVVVAAAALHFGSEVFMPLAIATLIAFALSPVVSILRRRGVRQTVAVLVAVTVAFVALGGLMAVMVSQLAVVIESRLCCVNPQRGGVSLPLDRPILRAAEVAFRGR